MSMRANSTATASFSGFNLGFDAIYPGTSQKVAFTSTSAQSAAMGTTTQIVRIVADQDCFIAIGTNPTANASGTSTFLGASAPEYFAIKPGDKIAVIQSVSAGSLYITEGA